LFGMAFSEQLALYKFMLEWRDIAFHLAAMGDVEMSFPTYVLVLRQTRRWKERSAQAAQVERGNHQKRSVQDGKRKSMFGQRRRSSLQDKSKEGERRRRSLQDREKDIGDNGSAQTDHSGDSVVDAKASSSVSLERSVEWSSSTSLFESSSVVSRHTERVGRICSKIYFVLCKSKGFWNILPWVVALTLLFSSSFYTVWVLLVIFDTSELPDSIETPSELMWQWLYSVVTSLAQGWFVFDPTVIVVRNNLSCTKTRIRTARYQTIEKFVVGPLSVIAKALFKGARAELEAL